MRELNIPALQSGGIITNYHCTSRCGHCLYGCSPEWDRDCIDETTLKKILAKIKAMGGTSVHIGGGEPFLNTECLLMVVEQCFAAGVGVGYVETNSSWCVDQAKAREIIQALMEKGLRCLLISMSPFHNEYIPFKRVKTLIDICRQERMNDFPWVNSFYKEIESFDDGVAHSLSEYEAKYGPDYLAGLLNRYSIRIGGRAIETFSGVFNKSPAQQIVEQSSAGCRELTQTGHFHFDLFGNYIPGLCTGLSIKLEDLGSPLPGDKYPILTMLYNKGVAGLLEFAEKEYGFKVQDQYLEKCSLCFDIRRYLAIDCSVESQELNPVGIYKLP